MTFKKDYINYLLYTVVNSTGSDFKDNYRLGKLVDTIMANNDVMMVTYLSGKTAGLEGLFKYLLYISDKIDKSQVTIFNLKDNFDYDLKNLSKICENISVHKSENVQDVIDNIENNLQNDETDDRSIVQLETFSENDSYDSELISGDDNEEETDTENEGKLTLIENQENATSAEVFELESITYLDESEKIKEESNTPVIDEEESDEESVDSEESSEPVEQVFEISDLEENSDTEEPDIENSEESAVENEVEQKFTEIEIEVRKPIPNQDQKHVKEEAITNEAYYKFETRFFEDVKILEKLFVTVDRDCKANDTGKLSEKCLQSLTEIIEITSELSSLSRQLSFDLIADIFLTMNLYYTKAISQPDILTGARIKLLDSSLALVNSLIKGEDYLNYDAIVDKIEKLKSDISGEKEEKFSAETPNEESAKEETETREIPLEESEKTEIMQKPPVKQSQLDSAVFKLKYLVKELEKSFSSIDNLKGEYSKFEALEKINELNNALRMIAKISAIVKLNDVLKLAEVTYVFLKYVKDYRMDLMEPEIKQIIKYIIFTFKMLLTNRKPEDFNVLVQHLNSPVKIFADS